MNLNMHIVLDALSALNPSSFLNPSIKSSFSSLASFERSSTVFLPDTLYLGSASDITACEGKLKNANLVCLGLLSSDFAGRNHCQVISLPDKITILEAAGLLFGIQKRYDEWNNRLLSSILSKQPMENFFAIAQEEIPNPLVLIGSLNTLILSAGELPVGCTDTLWREMLEQGYISIEHPLYSEILAAVNKNYTENEAFILKFPKHNHAYLMINIFQAGKRCGAIELIDTNRPFSLGQISLVTHLKTILEQAIKSIPDFQILSSNANSFVYQLLKHVYLKESVIVNCLKSKGWKVFDEFYCLNFLQNQYPNDVLLEILTQELGRVFPAAIVLAYNSGAIVILRNSDFTFDRKALKAKLVALSEKFSFSVGISSLFYDFKNLKRHYDECSLAIKYGLDEDPKMFIHFFEDYVLRHLTRFVFLENAENQFIHTKVELLHKYDLKNGTDLVRTLLIYFQFGQNKSLAAEEMHLHRNTLTYRLENIKNLVGIDCTNRFTNENEIFHIILSCKFLE
ncbi:helix-turn-helix domain-containing protein [Desulfosporosinus sp. PR]|uniref:PucR family transcriptional regulator n=1 Tax=Candidatus Desulfosporosinus nitrosoreducens TaxID=3401928 RepID=UPI0027F4C62E|nr:helix-turn-helix domain-containing protein [Desulfosporosinus sp. PR]MDQ7092252.1 helix-turn-helix domain-containing protein [Desulfosporosinus sp. PR]